MRRFAMAVVGSVVMVVLAAATGGCTSDRPEPENVTRQLRSQGKGKDPEAPPRPTPFSNPDKEPPGPRTEPLAPPEAVAKLVADGRRQLDAGKPMAAVTILRRCGNKIPPSVACEAALGIALTKTGGYEAHARYYLTQAADIDDPAVESSVYRELGRVAREDGQFQIQATALELIKRRGDATAEDLSALAEALSTDKLRRSDAADVFLEAFQTDDSRIEDLRKAAVLLSQVGRAGEALTAFETYKDKAAPGSPHLQGVEQRIVELRKKIAEAEGGGSAAPSKRKAGAKAG